MSKPSSVPPRKPEPYRATTRGNILKLVKGDRRWGNRAQDAAQAKKRMQETKANNAATGTNA